MYMSAGNMAFLIISAVVILGVILWVIAIFNIGNRSQDDSFSEGQHYFDDDNENYNNKNDRESMKYRYEDNSLEEEEKAMLGMASCVNSDNNNNDLYSFDEACSILEDR